MIINMNMVDSLSSCHYVLKTTFLKAFCT